ncbi:hypothetical protein MTR_1g117100 [Medicago truncatula]|uniref:Uncharacterized protein n=1 Tax=Medicago truncatula TaxID=3880 RepID=A0A072W2T3_MEDTR|nr:hypothetical protein MTR_1g117100 [Medicago truncatula]
MEKIKDKNITEYIIKRVESTKEKLQSFEDEERSGLRGRHTLEARREESHSSTLVFRVASLGEGASLEAKLLSRFMNPILLHYRKEAALRQREVIRK